MDDGRKTSPDGKIRKQRRKNRAGRVWFNVSVVRIDSEVLACQPRDECSVANYPFGLSVTSPPRAQALHPAFLLAPPPPLAPPRRRGGLDNLPPSGAAVISLSAYAPVRLPRIAETLAYRTRQRCAPVPVDFGVLAMARVVPARPLVPRRLARALATASAGLQKMCPTSIMTGAYQCQNLRWQCSARLETPCETDRALFSI